MASPTSLTIGASLPGEQFAAVGAQALKLVTDLMADANSPDMVKAAEAKKRLADWDAFALAQQQNNLEAERKEVEGMP